VPEPNHRPPFRIEAELAPMRVWEAMEMKMRLKISCDACGHETLWTPLFIEKRLARMKGLTLTRVASRLRCAGCRSNYVRLWKG
jgi:hypothetical protein